MLHLPSIINVIEIYIYKTNQHFLQIIEYQHHVDITKFHLLKKKHNIIGDLLMF